MSPPGRQNCLHQTIAGGCLYHGNLIERCPQRYYGRLPFGNIQVGTLRERFGRRLRQIRLGRRMSQEKFAELLDVSVDFLSLIERGRNAPSFETLEKIARRLRVPTSELFAFDRDKKGTRRQREP